MSLGNATIVTQVRSVVKCLGFIGAGHKVAMIFRCQHASSGRHVLNVLRGYFFPAKIKLRPAHWQRAPWKPIAAREEVVARAGF